MSLDAVQRAQTAADLTANLQRAALTPDEIAHWLRLAPGEIESILGMSDDVAPAHVWLVRDAIERTLQEEGDAGHWSVLTDARRVDAEQWFALDAVPAR